MTLDDDLSTLTSFKKTDHKTVESFSFATPNNAEDVGSIPGWERLPGEANVNPLQYSCLGNPMHRGAWWAITHGVSKELVHDLATKQQGPKR